MIKNVMRRLQSNASQTRSVDVVVHIGAPKSGSSAIQRFCVSHRDKLLELGYYYPEHTLDVNGVSGGHTQLAGALLNKKYEQADSTLQRWLTEAREQDACLLLSAEALYGQHEAVANMCCDLRVKVVAFLRHPIEYLLANHNQGVKRHFSTKRLGALLPEILKRPTGHLAGLPLLSWAEAFGSDNCCFMAYKSPSAGGNAVEKRFLKALEVPDEQAHRLLSQSQEITNRSYVKSALELKRLLNTVLEDMPAALIHQVDWSLQGYSDRSREETGYTMADLTVEMRERLEHHLLKQMAPVVECFPQLKSVAELPPEENHAQMGDWLNLVAPLAALKADAPQVVQEVYQRALVLRDQGRQNYAFCKLLDVLGIEFSEPGDRKSIPGLSEQQRNILNQPNAREADCLREMAVLLEQQGLLDDALFVIGRAVSRRPQGKVIQQIQKRIEDKQPMGHGALVNSITPAGQS